MLNSIGSSNAVPSFMRSSSVRANTAFDSVLVGAASSATASTGDVVQISATAQSQASLPPAPQFDHVYFHRLDLMSDDDIKTEVAKQADAISASQGLPSGTYNFASLTGGQALIVAIHLQNSPDADQDAITTFAGNISYDMTNSQELHDFVKPVAQYEQYARASDLASVKLYNDTLTMLASRSLNSTADGIYQIYKISTAAK